MAVRMTVIKKFTYRGDANEEWSNTYHLDGANPADAAAWNVIWTALTGAEKTCYHSAHVIIRGYGYTSDAEGAASVWTKDLTVTGPTIPGTLGLTGTPAPGDAAGMIWWKTDRLTSTGKPIYLRKFMHGPQITAGGGDVLLAAQKSAYEAFATLLASGAGVDGRHIRGPGQADDVIFASGASQYITTRTLKRRGKRPTTAP